MSSICARKGAVAQWLSLMGDGTGSRGAIK